MNAKLSISVLMAGLTWAGGGTCLSLYDSKTDEINPIDGIGAGCETCANFYRIERPILTGVNHVFIGVELGSTCPLQKKLFVYGATKGAVDLKHFQMQFDHRSPDLKVRGKACGTSAREAIERARVLTAKWQSELNNYFYLPIRMLITPVMGRACANAATEIEQSVAPLYSR